MTLRNAFGDLATEATLESVDAKLTGITPDGELLQAIESLRMAVQSLNRNIGQVYPDNGGRLRVLIDAFTNAISLSTVTNLNQLASYSATEAVPTLMRLGADSARRNISVT